MAGEVRLSAGHPQRLPLPNQPPQAHNEVLTTRVGLHFPPRFTFERWVGTGPKLARAADTLAWCLGDWLVYGQANYEGRYAEAVESVGLDYQTLRNYAWVARKFAIARRREGLSFQHHAEVASLSPAEQDVWLGRAEEHGWSKSHLRRQLRQSRSADLSHRGARSRLPQLRVEADRLNSWRVAAGRTGADLASWIVVTLDREAGRALGDESTE